MKKKILFLYAGGTIGQVPRWEVAPNNGEQWVLYPPESDTDFKKVCTTIISQLKELEGIDVEYELFSTKDSTNLTPKDWTALAKRIRAAQEDDCYDAVGVAHGTDTMAYTANAVAFALHGADSTRSGLQIPVVFTGAQNTVFADGGDGRFNLENMFRVLKVAIDNGVADVMINFWSRVLLAARTVKVSEKDFDAFHSPAYPDVGVINSLGITLQPHLLKKKSEASYSMDLQPEFSYDVITLDLTPGLLPANILSIVEHNDIGAFILKSHGEGNVPTEGKQNLIPVIKKIVNEYSIPVIITNKFVTGYAGAAHYEVGLKALQAGAIAGLDHTSVAVEVKARWLLGNQLINSVEGFAKAMRTSYVGEVADLET